jgi:RimJ/RimL family protein N-acetyltransferase
VTLRLALGMDQGVAEWMAPRLPCIAGPEDFGPYRAVGIVRDGEMVGGILYNNFHPTYQHIEMSIATTGPGWATRPILRALFAVPFEQYGVRRVGALTPHTGPVVAINMLPRLGFVREGTLRHWYAQGRHAAVFSMTVDEYRKRWN